MLELCHALGFLFRVIALLLWLISGSYRALAHRFRIFREAEDAMSLIGILVLYPIAFSRLNSGWSVEDRSLIYFFAIWLAIIFMFTLSWIGATKKRDDSQNQCWFGRLGEPAFAFGIAAFAQFSCGMGLFFLLGYACSTAQIIFLRSARSFESVTAEDFERLGRIVSWPFSFVSSRVNAATSLAGAALANKVDTAGALIGGAAKTTALVTAKGATAGMAAVGAGMTVVKAAREKAKEAPPGYVRRQSFLGRLVTFITGHLILNLIMGVVGFGFLLKIIAVPFAIFLWMLGWGVKPPEGAKERAHEVFAEAKEVFQDKKDHIKERLHDAGEAAEEKVKRRLPWWAR